MYLHYPSGLYIIRSLLTELSNEPLQEAEQKDVIGAKSNKCPFVMNGNNPLWFQQLHQQMEIVFCILPQAPL